LLGVDGAVRSAPDGYTLLFTGGDGLDIIPNPSRKLPYDPVKDLVPVAAVGRIDLVIAVPRSVPANTIEELVALAKAEPGKLAFSSTGPGTLNHMGGELLKLRTGIDILHVPYTNTAAAITDALSGRIQIIFTALPAIAGMVQDGSMKVLATAGEMRPVSMPQVPTMMESGFPDFLVTAWIGILAPAGTPPDIIKHLGGAFRDVSAAPGYEAQLAKRGIDRMMAGADEYAQFLTDERRRWRAVIAEGNIKLGD
jgi:tripartite-type tricarboxylate transporter receptor subunit TctC